MIRRSGNQEVPGPRQQSSSTITDAFNVAKPQGSRRLNNSDVVTSTVKRLRREFDLPISVRDETWSPSKSGPPDSEALQSKVKILCFKDPGALEKTIDSFREVVHGLASGQERLNTLLSYLDDPVYIVRERIITTSALKVHAWKNPGDVGPFVALESVGGDNDGDDSPDEHFELAPESPILSAKHGPKGMVDSFMEPAELPAAFQTKRDEVKAETSLSTTAKTSFAATSFTSEAGAATTSTAATSFDGEPGDAPTSSSTYPFSSPSEREWQRLELNEPEDANVKKSRSAEGHSEEEASACNPACKKRRTSDEVAPGDTTNINSVESVATMLRLDRQHPLQHQISRLPEIGFGIEDTDPGPASNSDFAFRFDRARLAQALGVPFSDLVHITTTEQMASMADHRLRGKFFRGAARPLENELENLQRHDTMVKYSFTISPRQSREGPLIESKLNRPTHERSNRIQRRYGSDRLLYADVSNLDDSSAMPDHLRGEQNKEDIREKYLEWLLKPKQFLGRVWVAFHLQPNKKSPTSKDSKSTHRLVFFAVSGSGLPEILLPELLNWLLPIGYNLDQSLCKAFARVDLALSPTISTLSFKPSQIRHVDDCHADGTPEDSSYDSTRTYPKGFTFHFEHDESTVMNDGCARMSVGAAMIVCEKLGLTHRRSAFQARINGAKGVWYISAPYDTSDPMHLDVWIEITASQKKINYREQDLDDSTCHPGRWSFDVVRHSARARTQHIHRDFMQILEDGGVPRDVLATFAEKQFKEDLDELERALASDDPKALRIWAHVHESSHAEPSKRESYGLPSGAFARLILLLEAGFRRRSRFLVECTIHMVERYMIRLRNTLRFPCKQSTSLIGIADPTGLLEPGHVHLCFSEPFQDESQSRAYLDRMEVLVTRHPTLRGSDIQKVKAVFVPELAHLKDIIVFPSKGRIPLAARLQGGDYDGDTFLACWDKRLTECYSNSPMPAIAPSIQDFGIVQKNEKLKSLFVRPQATTEEVHAWLKDVLAFKQEGDLLGMVTNHFSKLAYHQNSLWTPAVLAMAGLHDMLIDTAKNGYVFTRSMLVDYLQRHRFPLMGEMADPAYAATTKEVTKNSKSLRETICHSRDKKQRHILDHIMFNTVDPLLGNTLDRLKENERSAVSDYRDRDLEYAYDEALRLADLHPEYRPVIEAEIGNIKRLVVQIQDAWSIRVAASKESKTDYARTYNEKIIFSFWEQYEGIKPCNPAHPLVLGWLFRSSPYSLRFWDLLKASVLAHTPQCYKRPKFMFAIARTALCAMKVNSIEGSQTLTSDLAAVMKVNTKYNKSAAEIEDARINDNAIYELEGDSGEFEDWGELDDADLLGVDAV
ncbi:hypothetical protein MBLNU230_g7466t1 [Neophaeotheca triangularis]